MATQLGVINDALNMIGESELAASELTGLAREPARVMASAWPDAVDICLSMAAWRFASRIATVDPEGLTVDEQSTLAAPGYGRAFKLPSDHLRTNWLRDTPFEGSTPIRFHYEDGYWHADAARLYASYVSHQFRPAENWTAMFAMTVASYLAWVRGPRIRPAADENALRLKHEVILDQAKTQDASETPFAWHSTGRLVRSRQGGDGHRRSGGAF